MLGTGKVSFHLPDRPHISPSSSPQQLTQSDSMKQGLGHLSVWEVHRQTFPLLGPLPSRFPAEQMKKKNLKLGGGSRHLEDSQEVGPGSQDFEALQILFVCVTFISGAYPFLFSRLGEVFILLCLVTKCPGEETSYFMNYHTFLLYFLISCRALKVLCLFILFILSFSWPHNNGDFKDQRFNQLEHCFTST